MELKDLTTLATIGIGGFGRVLLVKYTKDSTLNIFALKQMKKVHILETKQEEHVFNERKIMLSCKYYHRFFILTYSHPFFMLRLRLSIRLSTLSNVP
jgi:serine/threonine protein kinase